MDIFNFLSLFGGLALFLFGMGVMGDALEKSAGSKLKIILEKLTENPLKGFVLGFAVTAVIQSSSATTVMVVGFVNSGIMQLGHAIGVIMGANVGTTVTSWILSLTGIQGDSIFIQLLKPSSFTPILAVIGIAMYMFSKTTKQKDIGTILLGFTVLMYGMNIMSSAVSPLADMPEFTNLLLVFSNPLFGVLAGTALTAVIQSSSASIGILQALSLTGAVTYGTAIPIIMGQNIGTCITALLSSIGTNKNARRAAMVHLYFNLIGTTTFLLLFYGLNAIIGFSFMDNAVSPMTIAVVHTVFNLYATAVMMPFANGLERLALKTIPDTDEEEQFQFLDERLLATPAIAIEQCMKLTIEMSVIARKAMDKATRLLSKYNEQEARAVMEAEEKIDSYEDKLGTYLVKISGRSLSMRDSREVSKLLHSIGDFERISDHAVNIVYLAKEISDKKVKFSETAQKELKVVVKALEEIMFIATEAFATDNIALADKVEPLEEVIDTLSSTLKNRHIKRLREGKCTIEAGFIFTDMLTNFERAADHCSNIAVCVIEIANDSFDTHEYLSAVKSSDIGDFRRMYGEYLEKYALENGV